MGCVYFLICFRFFNAHVRLSFLIHARPGPVAVMYAHVRLSFLILERRAEIGGTWSYFKYVRESPNMCESVQSFWPTTLLVRVVLLG